MSLSRHYKRTPHNLHCQRSARVWTRIPVLHRIGSRDQSPSLCTVNLFCISSLESKSPVRLFQCTMLMSHKDDSCLIFTGRNKVVAKVIFLHLSVILFTGGVSASVHAGIPHPPGADTPQSRHPPPPGADTPPRSRLQHTVNE